MEGLCGPAKVGLLFTGCSAKRPSRMFFHTKLYNLTYVVRLLLRPRENFHKQHQMRSGFAGSVERY